MYQVIRGVQLDPSTGRARIQYGCGHKLETLLPASIPDQAGATRAYVQQHYPACPECSAWAVPQLEEAARKGDLAAVQALLDRDPAPDARAVIAALRQAASAGQPGIVSFLINKGAPVDGRDVKGRTALHAAAARRQLQTGRLLLERGADPNAADRSGETPLHIAIDSEAQSAAIDDTKPDADDSWNPPVEMTRLLLDYGADAARPDNRGRTPLDWASLGYHPSAEVLLEAHIRKSPAGLGREHQAISHPRPGEQTMFAVSVHLLLLDHDGRALVVHPYNAPRELPGGRLEVDETPEQAIRRHCRRILGVEPGNLRLVDACSGPDLGENANATAVPELAIAYAADNVRGAPKVNLREISGMRFIHLRELPDDLAPCTRVVLERARQRLETQTAGPKKPAMPKSSC